MLVDADTRAQLASMEAAPSSPEQSFDEVPLAPTLDDDDDGDDTGAPSQCVVGGHLEPMAQQCTRCRTYLRFGQDTVVRWPCGHCMHFACSVDDDALPCRHHTCRRLCVADIIGTDDLTTDESNRLLCLYRVLTKADVIEPVSVTLLQRVRHSHPERAQMLSEIAAVRRLLAAGRLGPPNTPMRTALSRARITAETLVQACVSTVELKDVCGLESWSDMRALGASARLLATTTQLWRPEDLERLFGARPLDLV